MSNTSSLQVFFWSEWSGVLSFAWDACSLLTGSASFAIAPLTIVMDSAEVCSCWLVFCGKFTTHIMVCVEDVDSTKYIHQYYCIWVMLKNNENILNSVPWQADDLHTTSIKYILQNLELVPKKNQLPKNHTSCIHLVALPCSTQS